MKQELNLIKTIPRASLFFKIFICISGSLAPILIARFTRHQNERLFFILLLLAGWFTWTWAEYFFHRFLMHTRKAESRSAITEKHRHHHRSPSVFEVTLLHRILLFVFSCLFFYCSWVWNNYFTLFAGFFWGFAAFCYIHYLLHLQWIKQVLPRHHLFHVCHHCKYPDRCFGVTVTWWDRLFLTSPPKEFILPATVYQVYYLKK